MQGGSDVTSYADPPQYEDGGVFSINSNPLTYRSTSPFILICSLPSYTVVYRKVDNFYSERDLRVVIRKGFRIVYP